MRVGAAASGTVSRMDLGPVITAVSNLEWARSQMAFTLGLPHHPGVGRAWRFPAIMLIANYRGLRRGDEDALLLARRWSKVVAVTFAVGAVTGTVLSFEFGLLWPEFTGRFGEVFGVLFAIEGIFFFLEAIFVAIYIFGWERLAPWTHFWAGVPIPICGLGGAFSVVAVNSWMNQPQGFTMSGRRGHGRRSVEGDLQRRGAVRGAAHDPRGVPGHGVPGGRRSTRSGCCAAGATATTASGC